MGPRYTTRQFIEKARGLYGNKYDYSKVIYINAHSKVCIICKIHGEFWQTPNDHLSNHGCKKCGNIIIKNNKISSKCQFIEKARIVHGDDNDYSKFIYNGNKVKGSIYCLVDKNHGYYLQAPNAHLSGQGCPKCAINKISNSLKHTKEDFIQKAFDTHGSKYGYENFIYKDSKTKGWITCLKHGDFLQSPANHIHNKAGCPICKASKGELAIKAILDKYNIINRTQYNIPEIVANYEIDFYLPEYQLLIEFHGIQHYEYIPFFHDGNYTFEDQKNRDDLVRDAAIRWKYNYLEFNYKQLKHMTSEQFEELVIKNIRKYKFSDLN